MRRVPSPSTPSGSTGGSSPRWICPNSPQAAICFARRAGAGPQFFSRQVHGLAGWNRSFGVRAGHRPSTVHRPDLCLDRLLGIRSSRRRHVAFRHCLASRHRIGPFFELRIFVGLGSFRCQQDSVYRPGHARPTRNLSVLGFRSRREGDHALYPLPKTADGGFSEAGLSAHGVTPTHARSGTKRRKRPPQGMKNGYSVPQLKACIRFRFHARQVSVHSPRTASNPRR